MSERFYHSKIETPVGKIVLCQDGSSITRLILPGDDSSFRGKEELTPLLDKAVSQLQEFFRGERKEFDLSLKPKGTDFMQQVWAQLLLISYGKTSTFGTAASVLGRPGASRAVGMANHRNPLPILIPCHRVIGSRGSLIGYRGGLQMIEYLLQLEQKQHSVLN